MNAPTEDDLALILPDGTRYEGRGQFDDDGNLKRDMATCGHCGFTWNDALITQLTPTPSARCPNEYGHVYDEEGDLWRDNSIQFPRLLAEINATQEIDIKALCDSMDLEVDEVHELFDRADDEWERIKARLT